DAVANFPKRPHRLVDVRGAKIQSAVAMDIAVERPDFHAGNSFGDQFLGKITGGMKRRPVILQRSRDTFVTVTGPAGMPRCRIGRRSLDRSVAGTAAGVVDANPRLNGAAE